MKQQITEGLGIQSYMIDGSLILQSFIDLCFSTSVKSYFELKRISTHLIIVYKAWC